jgi:hypothetical protein
MTLQRPLSPLYIHHFTILALTECRVFETQSPEIDVDFSSSNSYRSKDN